MLRCLKETPFYIQESGSKAAWFIIQCPSACAFPSVFQGGTIFFCIFWELVMNDNSTIAERAPKNIPDDQLHVEK